MRAPHHVRPAESICVGVAPGAIARLLRGTNPASCVDLPSVTAIVGALTGGHMTAAGVPPQHQDSAKATAGHHHAAAPIIGMRRNWP